MTTTQTEIDAAYAAGHAAGLREANLMLTEVLRMMDEYESTKVESDVD